MGVDVTIDGQKVDMDPRRVPAFTYSIQDPLKPGSIKGSRSTTFNIPATNRAIALLGTTAMAERPIEDPVLRIGVAGQVYVENRLRVIERDRDEIRGVAVGNNAGWIDRLRNIQLRDLDLGESYPAYYPDMINSWPNEDTVVCWPVVDYGQNLNTMIRVDASLLRPSLRAHKLLEKAFATIGYTLDVQGLAGTRWKKYVLPSTDTILGNWTLDAEDDRNAAASITSGYNFDAVNGGTPQALTFQGEQFDPSGASLDGDYTAPTDRLFDVAFWNLTIGYDETDPAFAGIIFTVVLWDLTANALVRSFEYVPPTPDDGAHTLYGGWNNVFLAQGHQYYLGIRCNLGPDRTVFVSQGDVYWGAVRRDYRYGEPFNIASAAPKMTALELFKALCLHRNLIPDTDDRTNIVVLKRYDDLYKPHETDGVSFEGRTNHEDKPIKKDELKPRSLNYVWQEDDEDYTVNLINASLRDRNYGDHRRTIARGVLDEEELSMPFAPTAMRRIAFSPLGTTSIFIPTLKTHDGNEVDPDTGDGVMQIKWTPRLLYFDGTSEGIWQLGDEDGTNLLFTYPRCYFLHPDEQVYSMSFSREGLYQSEARGTISDDWTGFLRRFEDSFFLEIDIMLHDDELQDFDFGIPRLVHDGSMLGWYYFTEIQQKRYGEDEYTRCTLIQE
jgi:hypothetical protein